MFSQEAEDYSFVNESDTNVVDASFSPHHDMFPTPQEENSERHCSYATFSTDNSSTMSNSSGDDSNFERPAKVLKTGTTSNTANREYLSVQKDSSPSSYILSFDNVNPEPILLSNQPKGKVVMNRERSLPSKGCLENQRKEPRRNIEEGKKSGSVTRSPHHAQDHIIAERMRREKISQQFIALSALIPGLKKVQVISSFN